MKQTIKKILLAWRCAGWESRKEMRSTKLFQEQERDYDRVKQFYYVVA